MPEEKDRARYEETARVSLAQGGTLHATQCYLYERLPAPANGLLVLFCETAELFERLDFQQQAGGSLVAHARFLCADDDYVSEYTLDSRQHLHVRHTVRGPGKNYQVDTRYQRCPARSSDGAATDKDQDSRPL